MNKVGRKLRVLLLALILVSVTILAQPRRAEAVYDGRGWLFAFGVMAVATYATVMGVVCTPVAAAKGDDYPGGFSAAFGDCFSLEMEQAAPAEQNPDAIAAPEDIEETDDRGND